MDELIALISQLKIEHRLCSDHFYSCPLAAYEGDKPGSAYYGEYEGCDCGADEHNQRVDEVIAKLKLPPDSILFRCPECASITVDPADVGALEAENKRLRDALTKIYELNCELGYTLRMTRIGWDDTVTCENTLEPINVIAKQMGEANPMGKEYKRD